MRYAWVGVTLLAVVGVLALAFGDGGDDLPPIEPETPREARVITPPPPAPEPDARADTGIDDEEIVAPPIRDAPVADQTVADDDHATETLAVADETPELIKALIDADADATNSTDDTPEPEASVAAADGPSPDAIRQAKNDLAMRGVRLAGKGTEAEPFEVPWEVFMSAHETYRPKLGKTELPQWAQALSGSQVRVVGYVLFAEFAAQSDELLLMKNQWDGCCIGLPPTPYDAVEVKLAEQTDAAGQLVNYGTIKGTLKVDPYVVNDWLLSLYVLENATLESVALQGEAGHVGPKANGAGAGGW